MKNRKLSKLGGAITSGAASTALKVPHDQALYLMEYGKLGKVGYTTLRLALLPYGVIFPPYTEVSKYKNEKVVPDSLVITFFTRSLLMWMIFRLISRIRTRQ